MRETIHGALAGARDIVGKVVRGAVEDQRLGDDEVLARYVGAHRGDPWAIMNFAQRGTAHSTGPSSGSGRGSGQGGDVLAEALRYEREMEGMLRERMGVGQSDERYFSSGARSGNSSR